MKEKLREILSNFDCGPLSEDQAIEAILKLAFPIGFYGKLIEALAKDHADKLIHEDCYTNDYLSFIDGFKKCVEVIGGEVIELSKEEFGKLFNPNESPNEPYK